VFSPRSLARMELPPPNSTAIAGTELRVRKTGVAETRTASRSRQSAARRAARRQRRAAAPTL
jgi:hypothetical protein